jgi:hypothetical protein
MVWKNAVEQSPVGMAARVTDQSEVIVIRYVGAVPERIVAREHVDVAADELDGDEWTALGVRADPLAQVKAGSAIQLVSEMGRRLDQGAHDWGHVSQGRLFALEMLVATACVFYRNQLIAGQTTEARLAFAELYATVWLKELNRYRSGEPAPMAPGTRSSAEGQAQ